MTIMDDMSADYSLDEYIEQLLAEMPEPALWVGATHPF